MAVSLGLGLAGLAMGIYGAVKKGQAEKAAANNLAARPKYTPLPEDDSELNLAQGLASQGIGAGARQSYLNQANAGFAGATNAALMGGADANSIGQIYNNYDQGINRLAVYDDQARQQHLNSLLGTYSRYNAQRRFDADKQWQLNQYASWADRQQLFSQEIAGGQQTMNSGINIFTKGLAGFAAGGGAGGGDMGAGDSGGGMAGSFGGFGGGMRGGYMPSGGSMEPVGPTMMDTSGGGGWSPQPVAISPYYNNGGGGGV